MPYLHIKNPNPPELGPIDIYYEILVKNDRGVEIQERIPADKPLLALSHGFGGDMDSFRLLTPFLINDFNLLLWDHRGHGKSSKPKADSLEETIKIYDLKYMAEDGISLLKFLANKDGLPFGNEDKNHFKATFFLYGHSMGGMIALWMLLLEKDLFKKAAIGSSCCDGNNYRFKELFDSLKRGEIELNRDFFYQSSISGYNSEFIQKNRSLIEESVRKKMNIGPLILKALIYSIVENYDICEYLGEISIPLLLLHGKNDVRIPYNESAKIARYLKFYGYIEYENQGHEINKEIPERVANDLLKFFLS